MIASRGLPQRPPSSPCRFPVATPISPDYMAYWHVWGLEVILPCILIIQGGPGHSPTRVAGAAGLGVGQNIDCQGQFGHGVGMRG